MRKHWKLLINYNWSQVLGLQLKGKTFNSSWIHQLITQRNPLIMIFNRCRFLRLPLWECQSIIFLNRLGMAKTLLLILRIYWRSVNKASLYATKIIQVESHYSHICIQLVFAQVYLVQQIHKNTSSKPSACATKNQQRSLTACFKFLYLIINYD